MGCNPPHATKATRPNLIPTLPLWLKAMQTKQINETKKPSEISPINWRKINQSPCEMNQIQEQIQIHIEDSREIVQILPFILRGSNCSIYAQNHTILKCASQTGTVILAQRPSRRRTAAITTMTKCISNNPSFRQEHLDVLVGPDGT